MGLLENLHLHTWLSLHFYRLVLGMGTVLQRRAWSEKHRHASPALMEFIVQQFSLGWEKGMNEQG